MLKLKKILKSIYDTVKRVFKRVLAFLKKHSKFIITLFILYIVAMYFFLFGYFYCDINVDNNTNTDSISLCSMSTNNNDYFNDTFSDYICLTAPIVQVGSSSYRSVGSLFLGYEGNDCYLYYPVAYINNNVRSYEYRRVLCSYGYGYDISLAVQNTTVSSVAINISFKFYITRSNNNLNTLKPNIYDIDYFDYHCFVDDISIIEPSLVGYATVSDYYCYSNDNDYRFLFRLYNTGNLLNEPNTYNITDRYNPCLHFNDFSGYNYGYNNGYSYGYGIGENVGREYGEQVGYDKGYSEGVTSDGLFGFLSSSVENLLAVEMFPQFSIGDALWVAIGIALFGALMKVFRF